MKVLVLLVTAIVVGFSPAAHALLINNGLAPPNPDNVIDDASLILENVYVRNVGCPPAGSESDPCPSPGAATEVALVDGAHVERIYVMDSSTIAMDGGKVGDRLEAYGSSTVTVSGGDVDGLLVYDSSGVTIGGATTAIRDVVPYDLSTITLSGGNVGSLQPRGSSSFTIDAGTVGELSMIQSASGTMTGGQVSGFFFDTTGSFEMSGGALLGNLDARGSSSLTLTGGSFAGELLASGSVVIEILGTSFMVDGMSVPYGDLSQPTGTLTGTLASGDPINNIFRQGGFVGQFNGTIRLIPEPSAVVLVGLSLVFVRMARRHT